MKVKGLGFLIILLLGLYSCEKSYDNISTLSGVDLTQKSTTIATMDILAESVLGDADYEADYYTYAQKLLREIARQTGRKDKLMELRKLKHYLSGNGPEVSIDTAETGYPITITLDYGESTVLRHGQVLSGIIIVEISGDKNADGSARKVIYNGFSIDSVIVEGTVTELFSSTSDSVKTITVTSNLVLTLADGSTITCVSEKIRQWIDGVDTPLDHSDDIVQVTGKTETTTSAGESFSKVITEPLLKTEDCRDYVQGVVQYLQDGKEIAILDYGDGDCDKVATLTTSEGETVEIKLGRNKPKVGRGNKNHRNSNGKGPK